MGSVTPGQEHGHDCLRRWNRCGDAEVQLDELPAPYGDCGEEWWQLTTTVARETLAVLPTGIVQIDSLQAEGRDFAVKRAIVKVADPEAERPVIAVQWRPADAPEGPAPFSRTPARTARREGRPASRGLRADLGK